MKLCRCMNTEGVTAIMTEEHWKIFQLIKQCKGDPRIAGVKIMCFYPPDKINGSPPRHMTGTLSQLQAIIEKGGHSLVDGTFYIPFSANGDGNKDSEEDWGYIPTAGEVLEIFNIIQT